MGLDFLANNTNDLLIQDGDFVVDNGVKQQALNIISAASGELRQFPTLGVRIVDYLGSSIDENFIVDIISEELAKDNIELVDFRTTRDKNGTVIFDIDVRDIVV